MKCDLCKHENSGRKTLCESCEGMIRRLVAIEQRMNPNEVCFVGTTENASKAVSAASGQK